MSAGNLWQVASRGGSSSVAVLSMSWSWLESGCQIFLAGRELKGRLNRKGLGVRGILLSGRSAKFVRGREIKMASISTSIVWKTSIESCFEPRVISSVPFPVFTKWGRQFLLYVYENKFSTQRVKFINSFCYVFFLWLHICGYPFPTCSRTWINFFWAAILDLIVTQHTICTKTNTHSAI